MASVDFMMPIDPRLTVADDILRGLSRRPARRRTVVRKTAVKHVWLPHGWFNRSKGMELLKKLMG